MTINNRIKAYYDLKGYKSQKAFADEIGVSDRLISNFFNSKNDPSLDFLAKMIKAFGDLDARWLLTGHGNDLDFTKELDIKKLNTFEFKENQTHYKPEKQRPIEGLGETEVMMKQIELLLIEMKRMNMKMEMMEKELERLKKKN